MQSPILATAILFRRLPPPILQTTVRYARKPRWVPMAKSKMFKILEAPYRPRRETEEFARLVENYKIYNNSLWEFQRAINEEQMAIRQSNASQISEEGDLERIIAENERDNEIVSHIRQEYYTQTRKQAEDDIIKRRTELEEIALQKRQETEQTIVQELERFKNIITEDKLDEAIEKALAMEVDYSYAISKDGKIYKGRRNNSKGEDILSVEESLFNLKVSSTVSSS